MVTGFSCFGRLAQRGNEAIQSCAGCWIEALLDSEAADDTHKAARKKNILITSL
jgi:hypothetical protein